MLKTLISRKSLITPPFPQDKMSTLSAKKKKKKSNVVSWGQLNIFDHVIMVSMTEIHKLLPEGNIFKYSLGKRRKKKPEFFFGRKAYNYFSSNLSSSNLGSKNSTS